MTPSRTTPESDPMTRSRLSEAPLIVVDGVTVWRPEDQEDPLIKIEVGGSVHVRKASEWHALAVASFALSESGKHRDCIPYADIRGQIDHIEQNGISLAKFGGQEIHEGRCRELCAMYLREFIQTNEMGKRLAELTFYADPRADE
jgi:hypothetical protein